MFVAEQRQRLWHPFRGGSTVADRAQFPKLWGPVPRAAGFSPGILSTTNVQLVHLVLECCSLQPKALCCPALAGNSPGGGC
jgi:hypothetical protein